MERGVSGDRDQHGEGKHMGFLGGNEESQNQGKERSMNRQDTEGRHISRTFYNVFRDLGYRAGILTWDIGTWNKKRQVFICALAVGVMAGTEFSWLDGSGGRTWETKGSP